jgi:tetratricopeptide (TPR) repeat protein
MTPPFTKHRDSSEALACHHRGLELLESQQAPLAIAELERAVALEPGNAEFLKSLGNAQKAAGKLDDAIASYRRSLDITPDYLPSLYNLAVTLRETGNAGEAEQRFRRLRELEPNDVDTLFHLGGLLAARSQFVESAAVYRDALRLTPDNPYLWLALGRVTQGMPGQLEESIRCLQKAIELYPDLADAHYGLGLARSKLGMIGAAVASYRRALELEPNAVSTLNDLGNILQDEGRLDEAIALYRSALAVAPADSLRRRRVRSTCDRPRRTESSAFRQAVDREFQQRRHFRRLHHAHGCTLESVQLQIAMPSERAGDPFHEESRIPHARQSLHFAYAAALGQRHALLVALAIPGRCVYEQKKAASVLRFHVVDAHGHAERVVIRAPFLRHVPEHRRELGCLQQTRIDVGATGSRAGQA